MAFDKVKTLRAAERYLELGKIPAAIKEYCKIVENDPDDFTTLNMLGDLHVRVGSQAEAILCFRRIADHYRELDFALKAIAMFKKIDRLQPNNPEISLHLADLYAVQDLVVEARAHYLAVASAHEKSGDSQARLEILCKIADLDSQNTGLRLKLAEGYLKEGMETEAADAFTEAGQQLLARNAVDEALQAFDRVLALRPNDQVVLRGLLRAHIARGTADEAAEVIGRTLANNPEDLELLTMLASAHVEAEDPVRAEEATAALVAREPAAYLKYLEVARLFLRQDNIDEAVRLVSSITEQMLAEREEHQLLDLVDEFLACDSDNVQALRLLVRAFWWQRDMDKLKAALERLAEAAQAAGLVEDERYALTQLNRLAPDDPQVFERLMELGGAEESATAEFLPVAESIPEPVVAQTPDELVTTHNEYVFDTSATTPVGDSEFEWTAVEDMGEAPGPAAEFEIERGFTFEAVVAEELPPSSAEATPIDEDRAKDARTQELESVDFYISQGYSDIAIDTLDLLERQFGSHPDIDLRRRQLAAGGSQAETDASTDVAADAAFTFEANEPLTFEANAVAEGATFEDAAFEGGNFVDANHEFEFTTTESLIESEAPAAPVLPQRPAEIPSLGLDPGLAEMFEEYRASEETEENGNGDYETHYNLGLAYKEMDLFEEALEEFQMAASMVTPDDGTPRYLQCCNLLGHCFIQKGVPQLAVKWFNQGFNAPGATEDERQALRFELAAAYEQVGDLHRAIDLFTEVYGINVSYRGVNERLRELQARVAGKTGPLSDRNQNHEHLVN